MSVNFCDAGIAIKTSALEMLEDEVCDDIHDLSDDVFELKQGFLFVVKHLRESRITKIKEAMLSLDNDSYLVVKILFNSSTYNYVGGWHDNPWHLGVKTCLHYAEEGTCSQHWRLA